MDGAAQIAAMTFACIFACAPVGMALRPYLPSHYLSKESLDVVKVAAGMIALSTCSTTSAASAPRRLDRAGVPDRAGLLDHGDLRLGMMAETNSTIVVAVLLCSASIAGALFLVIEMDMPFNGIISISMKPVTPARFPLPRQG